MGKTLHHFGLRHFPLDKGQEVLWDDGVLGHLQSRFEWLLESPGIGLLTGEPGVGKTAALRHLLRGINPHQYKLVYLAETDFGRLDLYRSLAQELGLEPCCDVLNSGVRSSSGLRSRSLNSHCAPSGLLMRHRIYSLNSSVTFPLSSTLPLTPKICLPSGLSATRSLPACWSATPMPHSAAVFR